MLFDILTVFIVTLLSSLFLCTTSVHGLPTSSSIHQYIHSYPRMSLRHLHHHPVSSVDYDLGGDISKMSIGENNEYSTIENHDDDDDIGDVNDDDTLSSPSSSFFASSLDIPNESLNSYVHALSSKPLLRKLLLSLQQSKYNKQEKRSDSALISASSSSSSSIPAQFNFNPTIAAAAFADPSNADSVVNLSNLSESTRLSPSLKALVETNPFARAWLTMLLQKVMEEQPVPYIFKYGRRRKK